LAVLLKSGAARTVSEGLENLKTVRPGIALTAIQLRCIETFAAAMPPQ
jgi:hypothetical protein